MVVGALPGPREHLYQGESLALLRVVQSKVATRDNGISLRIGQRLRAVTPLIVLFPTMNRWKIARLDYLRRTVSLHSKAWTHAHPQAAISRACGSEVTRRISLQSCATDTPMAQPLRNCAACLAPAVAPTSHPLLCHDLTATLDTPSGSGTGRMALTRVLRCTERASTFLGTKKSIPRQPLLPPRGLH